MGADPLVLLVADGLGAVDTAAREHLVEGVSDLDNLPRIIGERLVYLFQ